MEERQIGIGEQENVEMNPFVMDGFYVYQYRTTVQIIDAKRLSEKREINPLSLQGLFPKQSLGKMRRGLLRILPSQ
ncbi:MAG: hypothetical protein QY310_11845 [Candidatus Jettenia sp. CY-1]|nr:MAG: hypothetical protein QY310_11845 [Candidatus Jettenia sp. CY-1]